MTVSKIAAGPEKAMATGDILRRLLGAHSDDDEEAFRSAAFALIGEERANNHRLLADDLERIVLSKPTRARPNGKSARSLEASLPAIPRDRDRGLALVRMETPDVPWHRLILPEDDIRRLKRIAEEHQRQGQLMSAGVRPTQSVLLVGPPGTGKTLAARVLASSLGFAMYTVRFDAIVSSLLGETAANLARVFEFLDQVTGVVLFDEFDAVAKERSDESEHGELKRVVNALLQLMDAYRGSSVLIAATNHQALLDSAVWRRFESIVYFRIPARQDRVLMLRRFLGGTDYDEHIVEAVAEQTSGASGADLQAVATYAARSAALEMSSRIQPHHLREALAEYHRRIDQQGPRQSE